MTTKKTHINLHDFKGFDDRIAIFKAGKHTDSEGNKVTITDADLKQMVNNFDSDHPFPFVVGHPVDNAPAYGWGGGLEIDGDTLYISESNQVAKEFEESVEQGRYRNRSVSIAKNDDDEWYVRHVGWLGAAAPAIKGLEPMQFSESATVHEFALNDDKVESALRSTGWSLSSIGRLLRKVKNSLIEKDGLEKAEEQIPEYEIDSINEASQKLRDVEEPARLGFSAQDTVTVDDEESSMSDDKGAATFTQADVDKQVADAEAAATAKAEANFARQAKCETFVNGLVDDDKILPKDKPAIASFLESLNDDKKHNFSQAEGAPEQTQLDAAMAIFSSLENKWGYLGEDLCNDDNAPEGKPTSAIDIAKKANEFMASEKSAGRNVTFDQAVDHVSGEDN